jgi:hypothetical protein
LFLVVCLLSAHVILTAPLVHDKPIDGDIEYLRTDKDTNVVSDDTKQDFVPSKVVWTVRGSIYLIDWVRTAYSCLQILVGLTFDPIIFDVCTIILYKALATVLVRTVPAFLLVMATING